MMNVLRAVLEQAARDGVSRGARYDALVDLQAELYSEWMRELIDRGRWIDERYLQIMADL